MNQQSDIPVNITSARTSRSSDIRKRQTRYLMSMGIRTVSFVAAIITDGWLRWTLVAAAIILPYVAVVLANATDRRQGVGPPSFTSEDRPVLEGPVVRPERKTTDD